MRTSVIFQGFESGSAPSSRIWFFISSDLIQSISGGCYMKAETSQVLFRINRLTGQAATGGFTNGNFVAKTVVCPLLLLLQAIAAGAHTIVPACLLRRRRSARDRQHVAAPLQTAAKFESTLRTGEQRPLLSREG